MSVLIVALKQVVDPVGVAGLYLIAILPVAIGWGFWMAGVVAVASYLTFSFFFVPPVHSFAIARADADAALLIALGTAYVVSELARRAHARAQEAQLRAEEAANSSGVETSRTKSVPRERACCPGSGSRRCWS